MARKLFNKTTGIPVTIDGYTTKYTKLSKGPNRAAMRSYGFKPNYVRNMPNGMLQPLFQGLGKRMRLPK